MDTERIIVEQIKDLIQVYKLEIACFWSLDISPKGAKQIQSKIDALEEALVEIKNTIKEQH